MAHYSSGYYTTAQAMPITGKDQGYPSYDESYYPVSGGGHGSYSVSPPESVDTSNGSSGGLYSTGSAYSSSGGYSSGGYPSAAASYAGSSHGGDYESAAYSTGGVDFGDYVQDRLDDYSNPIRMDHCMAKQAQVSGSLNAKERSLLERTKKAKARMAKSRAQYEDGLAMARDVHADLQWTHDSVQRSQALVSKKHTREYRKARERYPEEQFA